MVSSKQGIRFVIIAINITIIIAIAIRQFKKVIIDGGFAFGLIFALKLFVFIN